MEKAINLTEFIIDIVNKKAFDVLAEFTKQSRIV